MELNRVVLVGEVTEVDARELKKGGATVTVTCYLAEGDNVHVLQAIGKAARSQVDVAPVGARVYVEGALRSSTWRDAEGKRHTRSIVQVHHVLGVR